MNVCVSVPPPCYVLTESSLVDEAEEMAEYRHALPSLSLHV